MIHEKKHRLPLDCYRGEIVVAFTACLRFESGSSLDDETAHFIGLKLNAAGRSHDVEAIAWCMMPDTFM